MTTGVALKSLRSVRTLEPDPFSPMNILNVPRVKQFLADSSATPAELFKLPPWTVEIHPTSICCLDCVQCSYALRNRDGARLRRRHLDALHLELDTFGVAGLAYSGGGEPTGWSDEGVNLGHYLGKPTAYRKAVVTNAVYLDRLLTDDVFANVGLIQISLYGHTRELFRRSTGVDLFEIALRNLDALFSRKETARVVPLVTAKMMLNRETYRDVIDFYEFFSRRFAFDQILLRCPDNYEPTNDVALSDDDRQELDQILRSRIISERTNVADIIAGQSRHPVGGPQCWTLLLGLNCVIRSDGSVYLATPHPSDKTHSIGNITDQPLTDIWFGERRREIIALMGHEYRQSMCPPFCRHHRYNELITQSLIDGSTLESVNGTMWLA